MSGAVSAFGLRLIVIAAVGLGLRVAYTVLIADDTLGIGDFFFYQSSANLIADGRGYIQPFFAGSGIEAATAEHPPLWPALLAVPSALGFTGIEAHRLVGCGLGALTILAIGLLGRRAGGERVGLIAAGIAAVYPILITADGSLMSETLYGLLVALALLAAYRLRDHPGLRTAGILGALIALAALTRGEGLLLGPLLALPLLWRRWRELAVVAAAAVLVIAPWTARNWIVFDQPVLISVNDSTVLAGANCGPAYRGSDIGFWRLDCLAERKPGGNEAKEAERWRSDGLSYARDHAGRLPLVAAVRVLRTFDLYQPRRQVGFAEGRDRAVQRIGTGVYLLLVLPLALAGAVVLRRRGEPLLILAAPVAMVVLSSVLGYGLSRFRHAAELVFVVLAAVAVDAAARRVRAVP